MVKMPCLFVREFHGKQSFTLTTQVTPGCEWVLAGEGSASRKRDGSACLVREGVLYKRYDAKKDRKTGEFRIPPVGAIACDEPDPETGHWPHWVVVGEEPESKWHREAFARWQASDRVILDGTYELCGPHFSANPERFDVDTFVRHGDEVVEEAPFELALTFDGIRRFLTVTPWEGIVFRSQDRFAKIRRKDYGLSWPIKEVSHAAQ